jgi:lysine 6-dehydrogenase
MKMVVLGAGLMGRAAAYDMARQDDVERVVIADVDPRRLDEAVAKAASDKVEPVRLNVRNHEDVLEVIGGADAVLGAVSYTVNLELAKLAVAAGTHWSDMGGNNAVVDAQLALDKEAKAAGVSVIPDTGLAPGLGSPLAMQGIRAMDEAETVRIRVGGLPQSPKPPLNYGLVFSVQGLINEYVEPCVAIRDGRVVDDIEPLSDLEEIEFPEPLGRLEAFNTSGGTSTLPWTLLGKVRDLDYKTIRYAGHAAIVRAMYELGLMSSEPIEIRGGRVAPRDVLEPLLDRNLPRGDDDLVLMRVSVEGRIGTARKRAVYEMIDYADPETGLTAMMRCTAFPASVVCLMMARGQTPPGATPQELAIDGGILIEELRKRGLPLRTWIEDA